MPTPILATKLYVPPPRDNLVLRPRLVDRLNEGLNRKMTLISAPAGFGKTTLASAWIARCERPSAWLSLGQEDGDPASFWSHFIAALQTLALRGGDGLATTLGAEAFRALQSPQPPSGKTLLAPLLNEIASIPDAFVLVLDDYHLVDSPHVSHALAFLIERLPPQMHLVIVTRDDPDLPLARLRARGQLTELRVKDLRFTDSEAAEYLTHAMGLRLSPEDVLALEARTEGWIVGLQLAALSMQGLPDPAGVIPSFTGSHRYVLDYLLEEVLHKQAADVQAFLLQTSILDRMCGPLCEAVLLHPRLAAQQTLEHLERANLFLIPLDHERRWYRYHHLFRDLLRQRLLHHDSPEAVARLHIRASEWLEANGELAEAFQHALAGGEVDRAARLAESAWQAMNTTFQMGAWLRWVNQLPLSAIRTRPVLCTQMGLAYMDTGNVHASEARLRDAEQGLRLPSADIIVVDEDQLPNLPSQIAFARAYNAQSQGRFPEAAEYARRALELTPKEDVFLHAQASTLLMGMHWAHGDLDRACQLISDFVDAAERAGHVFFAIAGAFGKADILNAQGRLREVRKTYQAALELAAAHHAEQHTAHHHLGLALVYHEMGEDEPVARHLERSFELGRHTTIVDWGYRKSLAQAQLKDSQGDLQAALDLLEQAQRLYVRTPTPDLRPVDAMKALVYLKQGKLLKAQAWARKSGLSLGDSPDYLHEFERLTLARIALADREARDERHWLDTLGLLDRHLKLAEKQDRLRSQTEILILQALAFHARGEIAEALAPLERALMLAEQEEFLRIFAAEGKPMVEMLLQLKNRSLTPYVGRILALREPAPSGLPLPVISQPLVEPLSSRELDVLRLLAQGLSNQEIARKLFVALSTVKGHNLRIFAKLQARNRTEAVARARELGLL